jgi:hypothetical protein
MPWYALPYHPRDRRESLDKEFGVEFIPFLVILNAQGQVVLKNATDAVRSGSLTTSVIAKWESSSSSSGSASSSSPSSSRPLSPPPPSRAASNHPTNIIPRCPSLGHTMTLVDGTEPQCYYNYFCNRCRARESGTRWWCGRCRDDYCLGCHPAADDRRGGHHAARPSQATDMDDIEFLLRNRQRQGMFARGSPFDFP